MTTNHHFRILRALTCTAFASFCHSCAPSWNAPPVSESLVKASGAPVAQIKRGYLVHQSRCAKCHPFENPADYEPDALTGNILPVMARKSKLDHADEQAVLAYLLAARQTTTQSE